MYKDCSKSCKPSTESRERLNILGVSTLYHFYKIDKSELSFLVFFRNGSVATRKIFIHLWLFFLGKVFATLSDPNVYQFSRKNAKLHIQRERERERERGGREGEKLYIYIYIYIYTHTHVYIEREKERERNYTHTHTHTYIYIYIKRERERGEGIREITHITYI